MRWRRRVLSWLVAIASGVTALTGCATAWQDAGRHYRREPTRLAIESTPPAARVFVNDTYVGVTPLSTTVECEQEIRKQTRRVSYWQTQPGLALGLSVLSLGLYVPFSFLPVDTETTQEPTGTFRDTGASVRVEAEGYRAWTTPVTCSGDRGVPVRADLDRR